MDSEAFEGKNDLFALKEIYQVEIGQLKTIILNITIEKELY